MNGSDGCGLKWQATNIGAQEPHAAGIYRGILLDESGRLIEHALAEIGRDHSLKIATLGEASCKEAAATAHIHQHLARLRL